MQFAIDIDKLSKAYKTTAINRTMVRVFENFCLKIKESSFTVLYGPNGCGKSTLIHILAGIETFDSGTISIFGKNPAEANIGIVFQNHSATLFPWLKVVDNISFPLKDENTSKKDKRDKAQRFVKSIGFDQILDFSDVYPYQISSGQQQMVAIARALFTEAPVIFFDEAFSALDAQHKDNALLRVQQFGYLFSVL